MGQFSGPAREEAASSSSFPPLGLSVGGGSAWRNAPALVSGSADSGALQPRSSDPNGAVSRPFTSLVVAVVSSRVN